MLWQYREEILHAFSKEIVAMTFFHAFKYMKLSILYDP